MKVIKLFLILTIFGMLQGCINGTSPQSRYYRMTSLLDEANKPAPVLEQHEFLVGVGPIKLADYLDRPQIVGRSSANTLQLGEFDRWSGSLQDNLEITLTENLRALLGNEKVINYPWPRPVNPDYHVMLHISRFDASNNMVILRVGWLIMGENDDKLLRIGSSEIKEPVASTDYNELVAANSRAIKKLGSELVTALQEILTE